MLKTVLINDVLFHVYQAGQGPVVLFIHGFPLDHTMWLAQLEEFAQGYQVIAPDLRGFGRSGGMQGVVTMQELAHDLVQILDQLQISQPVTVCGLSMGGYIAFQLLQNFPERVFRLVLCDTRSKADDAAGQQKRRDVAAKVLEEGTEFLARDMPEKLFAPATRQSAPAVVARIQQTIRDTPPQAVAAASLGMSARPDMSGELSHITIPTLVVCGTEDAITPLAEMQEMAQQIPTAEFVEIPGVGHMAPLEHPAAFNAHLRRFLGATDI